MRLQGLHHVRFAVQDLAALRTFAEDFGLVTAEARDDRLVMRTRGGDSCCYVAEQADHDGLIGLAFTAEDRSVLDHAVSELGASGPTTLDLPGGGEAVTLRDPDGNEVLIVHGSARRPPEAAYPELVINTPFRRERFGRNQHSRDCGPAQLWRLGHIGLFVKDFPTATAWYSANLGLIGSDLYHVPGVPRALIVGFFRLDRGDDYVDHHVVAFMQDPRGGAHHISFEAQDYEAQARTHRYLRRQAHEPVWGVGRHPHGSHVFDVWRAPDGARFETFSDTDLFRASDGTKVHDIATVTLDEWRDEGPERYFL